MILDEWSAWPTPYARRYWRLVRESGAVLLEVREEDGEWKTETRSKYLIFARVLDCVRAEPIFEKLKRRA